MTTTTENNDNTLEIELRGGARDGAVITIVTGEDAYTYTEDGWIYVYVHARPDSHFRYAGKFAV